jgi:DNA-directed RNA polymerase specialized sigma24 family protein
MPSPDLARVYDDHAQALFAFLLNLTRDVADTRDIFQEVFARLARRPAALATATDERGFLLRTAHNAAIDWMRRRGSRERTRQAFAAESAVLFAHSDDPDEAAFRCALDRNQETNLAGNKNQGLLYFRANPETRERKSSASSTFLFDIWARRVPTYS